MLRYLRYLVLAAIAVVLVVFAFANSGFVTLQLLPGDLGTLVGYNLSADIPLFGVLFGGIVIGVLVGFVWEWVREHKHRAVAAEKTRELARMERELANMASTKLDPVNEVLALVDSPRKAG